jgi:hypothetical protein
VGVAGFGGLQVPKLLGVTVIGISNVDSHCVLWSFYGWYMALHLTLILTGYPNMLGNKHTGKAA